MLERLCRRCGAVFCDALERGSVAITSVAFADTIVGTCERAAK
jgi:hypothetical protein